MNFQQLEYCLAVQKIGHFGKAANYCEVTQATLSGMIKKLELELGITIFDRSMHPIKLTEDGSKLIDLSKEILELKSKTLTIRQNESTVLEGKLNLGVIPTVANSLLPMILPSLMKNNENLQLNVSEITTEEILRQLNTNQIDVGILSTPLPEVDYHISKQVLYYESLLVYGIKNTKSKFVSMEELKNNQIWLLEEGHCFRNQSMAICDISENNRSSSNLNFKGNSFETLLNLSDQFGGFTLLPELYVKQMNLDRQQKVKVFNKPIPVREISLITARPIAFKKTMEILAKEIKLMVEAELKTSNIKKSDVQIIEM